MSIIRFRNPVKDSRDVAFLFMSIAAAMAVGTKFYLFAIVFTAFTSLVAVLFERFGFGETDKQALVLRLRMPPAARALIKQTLREVCREFAVVSVDRLESDSAHSDYIYELVLKKRRGYDDLLRRVGEVSPETSVSLLVGEANVSA